jgi:mRNA interferase MazF
MERGELYWVDFGIPSGSEPGYRRPAVVIQSNTFNQTRIKTVIFAILTSNMDLAEAPGNIYIEKEISELSRDSIINMSQIYTVDKGSVSEYISKLPERYISRIDNSLRLVLDV